MCHGDAGCPMAVLGVPCRCQVTHGDVSCPTAVPAVPGLSRLSRGGAGCPHGSPPPIPVLAGPPPPPLPFPRVSPEVCVVVPPQGSPRVSPSLPTCVPLRGRQVAPSRPEGRGRARGGGGRYRGAGDTGNGGYWERRAGTGVKPVGEAPGTGEQGEPITGRRGLYRAAGPGYWQRDGCTGLVPGNWKAGSGGPAWGWGRHWGVGPIGTRAPGCPWGPVPITCVTITSWAQHPSLVSWCPWGVPSTGWGRDPPPPQCDTHTPLGCCLLTPSLLAPQTGPRRTLAALKPHRGAGTGWTPAALIWDHNARLGQMPAVPN